ncbi:MAG: hypothetical protein GEU97_18725 [Actinophytocola sp.]|nr:hypothetical protein [Actinophytocola sp.]
MIDNTHPTPSGEVTNLGTAIAFTSDMRDEFRAAVGNIETMALQSGQIAEWTARCSSNAEVALASLAAGDVTGEAVNSLNVARQQIQSAARNIYGASETMLAAFEEFGLTADALEGAHRALQRHTAVAEAYAVNPDAGSKQFNTYH